VPYIIWMSFIRYLSSFTKVVLRWKNCTWILYESSFQICFYKRCCFWNKGKFHISSVFLFTPPKECASNSVG